MLRYSLDIAYSPVKGICSENGAAVFAYAVLIDIDMSAAVWAYLRCSACGSCGSYACSADESPFICHELFLCGTAADNLTCVIICNVIDYSCIELDYDDIITVFLFPAEYVGIKNRYTFDMIGLIISAVIVELAVHLTEHSTCHVRSERFDVLILPFFLEADIEI